MALVAELLMKACCIYRRWLYCHFFLLPFSLTSSRLVFLLSCYTKLTTLIFLIQWIGKGFARLEAGAGKSNINLFTRAYIFYWSYAIIESITVAKNQSSLVMWSCFPIPFFFSEDIEILLRERATLWHELDSNQSIWQYKKNIHISTFDWSWLWLLGSPHDMGASEVNQQ